MCCGLREDLCERFKPTNKKLHIKIIIIAELVYCSHPQDQGK